MPALARPKPAPSMSASTTKLAEEVNLVKYENIRKKKKEKERKKERIV